MVEVDILMAAYNGEKYISEQIDSILNQTFKDFRLIIRDDGSSDKTPEIIEDYAKKYPEIIKVIHDDVICKNPTKNFFELMKYAEADYVMFSDQDDYWLPYKIQITLDYMKKTENENPGKPALVFCAGQTVDENLNTPEYFNFLVKRKKQYENFVMLLICNVVGGCVQMINRPVYKTLRGGYDNSMLIYDYWIALFACACGKIYYIPMILMLHRHHSKNVTGISGVNHHTVTGILKELISNPIVKFKSSKNKFLKQKEWLKLFHARYSKFMPADKIQELENYTKIFDKNESLISRFKAVKKISGIAELRAAQILKLIVSILIF